MSDQAQCVKVWCLLRDQFAHVKPVETLLGDSAEFIYDGDWSPEKLLKNSPDLVLCVNDYHYDVVRCLDAARKQSIPSLTLQDGILEWRCQYGNPLFGAGGGAPQHQPVIADKIACIGAQSFRQIAAWGNSAKVELTGMPRLDYLLGRSPPSLRKPGSRVLVMTAKNPGFTAEQREITLRSLQDVKAHLSTLPDVQVIWRVSKEMATSLEVNNQFSQLFGMELVNILEQVDAVITTPSTAILEAMLLGRPVAALDYHNVPRFLPTVWTISARDHIRAVVSELLNPPATQIAFQKDCLADSLHCDGPSADRVCALIMKMIATSQEQRRSGIALNLPQNLLAGQKMNCNSKKPALAAIYSDQAVFQESNVEKLQVRLARAENENLRLKTENAKLKKKLDIVLWMREGIYRLTRIGRPKGE